MSADCPVMRQAVQPICAAGGTVVKNTGLLVSEGMVGGGGGWFTSECWVCVAVRGDSGQIQSILLAPQTGGLVLLQDRCMHASKALGFELSM